MEQPVLIVSAGANVTNLSRVSVNSEVPVEINSDVFEGRLVVRVKDFHDGEGNVSRDTEASFFAQNPDLTWSIQVQGRFLQEVDLDKVVFGNVFDKPIRDQLPYGTSLALKFTSFVDPALEHDVYADKPWAWSPLISTMNKVAFVPSPANQPLPPWKSLYDEDVSALYPDGVTSDLPDDVAGRRRYFALKKHRQGLKADRNLVLSCNFENNLIDFTNFSLNLPIAHFQVPLARLYSANEQPVTYICRDNQDRVFFAIQFALQLPE